MAIGHYIVNAISPGKKGSVTRCNILNHKKNPNFV